MEYGIHRSFERTNTLFADLPGVAVAFMASVSADIALVVESDGTIIDFAYQDHSIDAWNVEAWLGRQLSEVVTPECVDKIDALLDESKQKPITKKRQVNHAGEGIDDLPIAYRLVAIDGLSQKLAIGEDYRKLAEVQQRLVQTQFELETEYRKIREAEGRYRTIFQKSGYPLLAVNGESGAIIDANLAATSALGVRRGKLSGDPVTSCFTRGDRAAIINTINNARHAGALRTLKTHVNETDHAVELTIEPYRENGATNVIVTIANTGDHAHAAHNGISPDLVLDSFPEALVTTDQKGNIVEANDQFLDLVHVLNKSALISRNINNWLGASTVDMQVLLSRLKDERQVRQFSSVIRDELGETKNVLVSASRYGDGEDTRIGIFVTDSVRRDTPLAVPSPGSNGDSSDFAELVGRVPLKDLIREASDVIEKMCIEAALRQTDNNRASAADMLGLSRQSLYIKLRRHGLEDFTGAD
ncbi:MAG: transcriptional regulator PpsR [Pseudomonadota bacterium]